MKIVSKIKRFILLLPLVAGMALIQSCTESIEESTSDTLARNTIISYLQKHFDVYGEYLMLLDSVKVDDVSNSSVSQLLDAQASYTCFAPTNEAIHNYLSHLVDSGVISNSTWEAPEFNVINPETNQRDLLEKVRRTIVCNTIIDAGANMTAYQTSDFSKMVANNKNTTLANLMNCKLQITSGVNTKFAVNGCAISDTNCDISCTNGRIHQIQKVIAQNTEVESNLFKKIVENKTYGYYAMACLIGSCGLYEELSKIEDEEYFKNRIRGEFQDLPGHPTFKGSGGPSPTTPGTLPEHRYYGYTVFAEGDDWWEEALGLSDSTIHNIPQNELVEKINAYVIANGYHLSTANTDKNYTDENNALNQFVTYHIIPAKIEPEKLVIHFNELWYSLENPVKQASVYDYYTTMGKRRLLKTYEAARPVGGNPGTIYLNRFPILNNATDGDYTEMGCDSDKQGIEIQTSEKQEIYNTYFYKISDCLFFNDRIAANMGSERIRIDVASIFKEFITNDIRCNSNYTYNNQCVGIPCTENYRYLDDCDIEYGTEFYYLTGRISNTMSWANYQGDELNIVGNYDFTIKLPPVPKDGIYELRMGVSANDRRGICQVYWGNNKKALPSVGMPFDLRMGGTYWMLPGNMLKSIIGWEEDIQGDDEANAETEKKMRNNWYMKAPNQYYMYGEEKSIRHRSRALRRIILREEMKADETYYIRFRNVMDDSRTELFLDYFEFCPKEIYDNPGSPEDIW